MKTAIRPSVRMSVDPVPVYQSKREVSKNFKFSEKKNFHTREHKRQRSRSHGLEQIASRRRVVIANMLVCVSHIHRQSFVPNFKKICEQHFLSNSKSNLAYCFSDTVYVVNRNIFYCARTVCDNALKLQLFVLK